MVKCQVCAYENEDGAEYCEECGVRLGGTPAPQPPPVSSGLAVAPSSEPPPPPPPPSDVPTPAAGTATAAKGCIQCHAPLPDGSKFCAKCGARQDQPAGAAPATAAAPKCPSCGVEADPGAAFCANCGARISAEAPAPSKPKGDVIRLRMVAGKDKDKLFVIEKGEVRIGRLNENDIPLEADGYVSGKHTRISKQGGEFFVEDLGSTNGTFLKVRKLTRLSPGDEIKVGQSIFRLE